MRNRRFGRRETDAEKSREYVSRDRRHTSDQRVSDRRKVDEPVAVERRRNRNRRRRERRAKLLRNAADPALGRERNQPSGDIPRYVNVSGYSSSPRIKSIKNYMHGKVMAAMDCLEIGNLSGDPVRSQLIDVIVAELAKESISISGGEQRNLIDMLVDDIVGFGPLEPLLADDSISNVMVNGPENVWVERGGEIELTDVTFDNSTHLMNVISRILSKVDRRVDESCPIVDTRLPDGNRINVVIPPLSYRFASISIRKFVELRTTLDQLVAKECLSADMAMILRLMTKLRLNILVSGGAGTGKTTLLNAMSRHIDPRERIVTIEDTAELQLSQPNVVSLESGGSAAGSPGSVVIGDLLNNALRMRPDRILVGDVCGAEAGDMLQAMNTGHDGTIATIHANSTRNALMRFENMICMADKHVASKAIRQQIASAINAVVQVSRVKDGIRRVTSIAEVVGVENDTILTQELYRFAATGDSSARDAEGKFEALPFRPVFLDRVAQYKLTEEERAFLDGSNNASAAA